MEARSVAEDTRGRADSTRWRLWTLVPILLLVAVVALFSARGGSVLELVGQSPPPADEFDIRRVELSPGEVRIRVTNPQREDLTIATVTVDDAIVPFTVEGDETLGRLRSSTIVVPYDWVEDEPLAVGVTSSTGIQTTAEVAAAVETPGPSVDGFFGYALIGALVGIVPVALGLLWLPSLRRARPEWLAAFMALTAGLLTFLAVEALAEALELQAVLPGSLGGPGLVVFGVALSYLALTFLAQRLGSGGVSRGGALGGLALALLVAIGIGVHNFGEGLAIGTSFALGELTLGTFLIVGFMIHNVTEGLGIAAPAAEGSSRPGLGRLALLTLIAGAPTILGAWIGGYITNDVLGVLFFSLAAGAALQVVVEVVRYVARRAPGGLTSGYAVGGFLAGLAIMYVTGLLV
jgi:ZIP family zinc transporter